MNILADECVDFPVIKSLREKGYDVLSISEDYPGIDDDKVIQIANKKNRIILTVDKDFGEINYRLRKINKGVVLYRLSGLTNKQKSEYIINLFDSFHKDLINSFTVVNHNNIRIKKQKS